ANYVIDPAVTGSITVRTSKPIPASDVVGVLNSILNLNGAALIQQGDLYKIVPAERAAIAGGSPALRRIAGNARSGSGILAAPIRYADATQLAEILQPFVANQGAVQLDAARNILLLTGTADQVATMAELIDMFDVDWMKGMSFGLYPLDDVVPTQLAGELEQIFGDPESGLAPGGLRLVPLDRLSALLVITAQPDYLDRAARWIERLDQEGEGEGEQVFVYAVQNGRASDLASVLGELFDIRSSVVGEPSLLAPGLEPVELGSSLPTFDDEGEALGEASREPERFGGGLGRPRPDAVSSSSGQRELTPGGGDSDTRIVADETSNSLLIRGTAKTYRKIRSALRELDKQPLQVLLEATIAEVSLENELSYGIQWFLGSGDSNLTFSDFADRTVGERFPTLFSGFSGLLARGDVRVLIDALDSVADLNVISSPQVLVLDNQTAQLEVGDEVPIPTQQAERLDAEDPVLINTVEYNQTGVILNVTPRVNASGLVILDIEQEVSDVVLTTSSGIDAPTFAQRRIGTSVAVGSDQTVVLGGLIEDSVDEIHSGIPFLKDIPWLGLLFGRTSEITERTELLVLITPKVLTNQVEAVAATNELRRRLRSLEPLQAKIQRPTIETDPIAKPVQTSPVQKPNVENAEKDDVGAVSSVKENYVVQLASVPSEADAWDLWDSYQKRRAKDFVGLRPKIKETKSGDRTVYGLQVGPFQGFSKAKRFCSTLKLSPNDCLVIEK
ncbi:MAG: type II secretion system secretin GspD, partial [Geminicoccaceae bacterium]